MIWSTSWAWPMLYCDAETWFVISTPLLSTFVQLCITVMRRHWRDVVDVIAELTRFYLIYLKMEWCRLLKNLWGSEKYLEKSQLYPFWCTSYLGEMTRSLTCSTEKRKFRNNRSKGPFDRILGIAEITRETRRFGFEGRRMKERKRGWNLKRLL